MRFFLALAVLCCIAVAADLDLVRIDVATKDEIVQLARMGVVINQVHADHVVAEIAEHIYSSLATRGFTVTLLQKNITEVYRQNSRIKSSRGEYLTYAEYVDSMVQHYTLRAIFMAMRRSAGQSIFACSVIWLKITLLIHWCSDWLIHVRYGSLLWSIQMVTLQIHATIHVVSI